MTQARMDYKIDIKAFHEANYAKITEDLKKSSPQEKQIQASGFLLGIDLSDFVKLAEQPNHQKAEELLNGRYKQAMFTYHPDRQNNQATPVEAEALTKLVGQSKEVLQAFLENNCQLKSNASMGSFFDGGVKETFSTATQKYKTQYDVQSNDPYDYLRMARDLSRQYTVNQNWGTESHAEAVFVDSNQSLNSLAVYNPSNAISHRRIGTKTFTAYGPEVFFELLISGSLPRRFQDGHFSMCTITDKYDQLKPAEKARAQMLIKKCLTHPIAVDFMKTDQLLYLAQVATENGFLDIGVTPLEVMLFYLKKHPFLKK